MINKILLILLLIIVIYVLNNGSNIEGLDDGTARSGSGGEENVKWGVCLALNSVPNRKVINTKLDDSSTIPISKIIKDIDIFWDWNSGYNDWFKGCSEMSSLGYDKCILPNEENDWEPPIIYPYDISIEEAIKDPENNKILTKFIPMQWGPVGENESGIYTVKQYFKFLSEKSADLPDYAMSWNEPDMTGSILPAEATGKGDTGATSCGYWLTGGRNKDTFVYGNAGKDITSLDLSTEVGEARKQLYGDTTFSDLMNVLYIEYGEIKKAANGKNIQMATPVTANGALISEKTPCRKLSVPENSIVFCSDKPAQIKTADGGSSYVSQPCGAIYKGDGWESNTLDTCDNHCSNFDKKSEECNGFPLYIEKEEGEEAKECKSGCGMDKEGKALSCRCSGWLRLLKYSNTRPGRRNYPWDKTFSIINIHGYHYFAHFIKLRILATMIAFYDDIYSDEQRPSKKKIWLTETCCIYPGTGQVLVGCGVKDTDKSIKEGIYMNVNFINELFWKTTKEDNCVSEANKYIKSPHDAKDQLTDDLNDIEKELNSKVFKTIYEEVKGDELSGKKINDLVKNINKLVKKDGLPGLRTNTKFEFMGKNDTWKGHGLDAVTYFTACIPSFHEPGFHKDSSPNLLCDSRIFDSDGNTNCIWEALKNPPESRPVECKEVA